MHSISVISVTCWVGGGGKGGYIGEYNSKPRIDADGAKLWFGLQALSQMIPEILWVLPLNHLPIIREPTKSL